MFTLARRHKCSRLNGALRLQRAESENLDVSDAPSAQLGKIASALLMLARTARHSPITLATLWAKKARFGPGPLARAGEQTR